MSKRPDLELPIRERTKLYRFFEMLPALMAYSIFIVMLVLAFIDPLYAAIYLLLFIITMFVRAMFIAYYTIRGYNRMEVAMKVDWRKNMEDLNDPQKSFNKLLKSDAATLKKNEHHIDNLKQVLDKSKDYPLPKNIYNAVIVAAYNEKREVIEPTMQSLLDSDYDVKNNMIIVFAYEERGGEDIEKLAHDFQKEYKGKFKEFLVVKHPRDLPDEVVGKGPNITYAGKKLQKYLEKEDYNIDNVIITTLDCDNKPYPTFFSYLTYEYVMHKERNNMSFQPISLYTGNIWDAPAPMRVIATGNSFWTIIVSMREHMLRNFASHSQPMKSLIDMDFWSVRSIVEDGHQYWRSFFHFKGNYSVVPIHVPIYQDAVMAETLKKTFITQFKQLRRWSYGASDVPYVAVRLFSRKREIGIWDLGWRFATLLDSHVSLGVMALMIAFGAWVPLLINPEASTSIAAHNLPMIVSRIQTFALVGILIGIVLSFRILPPRPARYGAWKTVKMVLQWTLIPLVAILYNSLAALNAQMHLLLGKYLDKFDVTEKSNVTLNAKNKN